MATTASVIASRLDAAIAHRTWSIGGDSRSHFFLLGAGRCVLTCADDPGVEIGAPALLWLPHVARGTLQVLAGATGFTASVSAEFVQHIVGEAASTTPLRPLLDQFAIGSAEALMPQMPALSAAFTGLVDECQVRRPGAQAMIRLYLGLLLVQLWRSTGLHGAADPHGATAPTVQRFAQLVELHYRDGLGIDAFAARLGVTRAHLHDACLRATGRTPLALVHDRLLAEARARLEQTEIPVEQVGYGIGFRDPSYFNRFFKRLTGQPPGAYRRAATAARTQPAVPSFAAWP